MTVDFKQLITDIQAVCTHLDVVDAAAVTNDDRSDIDELRVLAMQLHDVTTAVLEDRSDAIRGNG